ncbi:MAG: helix-turn-helix transcriptional regulator [Thermoleophilia bacterium]
MSVRESLLALLAAGPRHGYQLKTDFRSATAGVWRRLNIGQVYSTLERAGTRRDGDERTAPDAEGRRMFTITPIGRTELAAFMDAMRRQQAHRPATG